MSFLKKIFRKKTKEHPLTTQEAIQQLNDIEQLLKKRADILEASIEQELHNAKKFGTKQKRQALKALKAKKNYERQLQQLDATLTTLEFQREHLENSDNNAEVLKTMSFASKAMKIANDNLDLDKIHELKDMMDEQQELANEVNDAVSGSRFRNELDDDELMRELSEIELERGEKELSEIQINVYPEVPMEAPLNYKQRSRNQNEDNDYNQFKKLAT